MPLQTALAAGERLPDFPAAEFSRFRGKRDLVVLLSPPEELVVSLAARSDDLAWEEAQVLVLAPEPRGGPFSVWTDPDLSVHRALGGLNKQGEPSPAVYVTDRYGEIWAAFRSAEGIVLPTADAILGWLEFINSQCPE